MLDRRSRKIHLFKDRPTPWMVFNTPPSISPAQAWQGSTRSHGAAKFLGLLLNNPLLKGSKLLQYLIHLLLCFRKYLCSFCWHWGEVSSSKSLYKRPTVSSFFVAAAPCHWGCNVSEHSPQFWYVPRNQPFGVLLNRPTRYSNRRPTSVRLDFKWTTAFDFKFFLHASKPLHKLKVTAVWPIKIKVGTVWNRLVRTIKLTPVLPPMLEVRRYWKTQQIATDADITSVCFGPTIEAVHRKITFPCS